MVSVSLEAAPAVEEEELVVVDTTSKGGKWAKAGGGRRDVGSENFVHHQNHLGACGSSSSYASFSRAKSAPAVVALSGWCCFASA